MDEIVATLCRYLIGFVGLPEVNQIFDTPQPVSHSGGHRWGHADGSVNLNEVVGKVVESGCSGMAPVCHT